MTDIVPTLLQHGLLKEVQYKGGGKQRWFSLGVKMAEFEKVCAASGGVFEAFIGQFLAKECSVREGCSL